MGLFSGIMDFFSGGNNSASLESYQKAVDAYTSVVPTSLKDTAVILQRAVLTGQITPEQAQAQLAEQSATMGITIPAEVQNAQMTALLQIQDIAKSGLTASDRAQLDQIYTQEAVKERGQREAIMNEQAARGLSGSGQELAMKLIAEQGAADRASAKGTELAGLAQQRALQAIKDSATLSGNIREQSYNEQLKKAEAADAISKFNAQMKQQVALENIQQANSAQAKNIENQLAVQKINLDQQKAEQIANQEQANKEYQQQLSKAQGISGTYTNMGQAQGASGANTSSSILGAVGNVASNWDKYAKAGSAISSGLGSMGASMSSGWSAAAPVVASWFSDEELKKNKDELTDDQISNILDKLTGYSYQYKGSNEPSIGVMAQDLEKTPLKENVVDTPKGKMVVSDGNMQSAMLAALANINKRVNSLEGK